MNIETYDKQMINHYVHFLGKPNQWWSYQDDILGTIRVLEFAPRLEGYDWIYLTVGCGHLPMPNTSMRIELLIYAQSAEIVLASVLASLAAYPFEKDTFFAKGHTVAGSDSITEASPLTDFIILPIYFEAEGFDQIDISETLHVHILCALPIYRSEKEFAVKQGWRSLVEKEFMEAELMFGDLQRSAVV